MNARDLPYQPIIREALEANGYTPEMALNETYWLMRRSPFTTSAQNMDLPFLFFDADSGSIDWGRNSPTFQFRKYKDTYKFELKLNFMELPVSFETGFINQSLEKITNIPGAEGFIITEIKKSEDQFTMCLKLA